MDFATLDNLLQQSVYTASSGAALTAQGRQAAILKAVVAYSRYRPALRRMGDAQVVKAESGGATTITVVGGLLAPGSQILIDAYGPAQQTATVSTVAPLSAQGGNTALGIAAQMSLVTLTAALINPVAEGAPVAPVVPVGGHRGLAITAGQDTYRLPSDFVSLHQDSFDVAVGKKAPGKKEASFYDSAYRHSALLSGGSYGYSTNYGPGGVGGYPISGDPFNNPNAFPGAENAIPPGQTIYRILPGAFPLLVIQPAPTSARFLDFYYHGIQVPASVPASDADAVLAHARYDALSLLASKPAQSTDGSVFGIERRGSKSAEALRQQAEQALVEFDQAVRLVAYMTSG